MHGFIVVDKPAGVTSAAVVAKVKKLLPKDTKIGHTGTLDPNVTGVLALAIGRATKGIAYLSTEKKVYRCSMQFGIKTDSADIWGNLLERQTVKTFEYDQINRVLKSLSGKIEQVPPMYSAVKHDGKRLYQLAREGKTVARRAKTIEVFSYDDVDYQSPFLHFTVSCSRGTYVRTLCEDIASALDSVACMTALQRTVSGPFVLNQAKQLAQLTVTNLAELLLPIDILFTDATKIRVDYKHAHHLLNGVKVNLKRFIKTPVHNADTLFAVYYHTHFIGIAKYADKQILLERLFTDKTTLEDYHDHIHNNRTRGFN